MAISERRQSGIPVQREARFRTVFAKAGVGAVLLDVDGRALETNAALQRMLGYSAEELRGRLLHDLAHPGDAQQDANPFRESPAGGNRRDRVERRYLKKSGETIWVRLSVSLLRDAEDGPAFGIALLEEITERKLAEQSRRDSEDLFRLLADSAPVLIWMSGPDKRCTYFNRGWLDFTGRTLEQELGDGWAEGVHPGDRQRCMETYTRAFDAREPFTMDYRLRRRDGEYRWVLDSGVPAYGADRRFTGYLGSCTDITERKQAEEERWVLVRSVFSSLYGHVAVLDREGTVLALNDAWERDGLPDHDGVPALRVGANYLESLRNASVAHDPNFDRIVEGIEAVLAGRSERFMTDFPCASSTRQCWFELIAQPLRRPEGGAVISHIDITARRQAEIETQTLRRELWHVSRVATVGELTASLAHELNQPLTAILSNAQTVRRLLDRASPDFAEVREILDSIVSDDQRAGEIIRRLRNLLKKSAPDFVSLDINGLILEVGRLTRNDAVIKNVAVALELRPDLPNVRGDRIQLQQVVLNLMLNAFDAMKDVPAGERQLKIATRRVDERSVEVAVQDRGAGISADRLEKVFEPFYSDKPQGMGIGLAVCRSIVAVHGGRIWAETGAGRGATFRFTLPIGDGS